MQLEGATALVTGGTRGIGRALAIALTARGAKVLVCGRDATNVRALRESDPSIGAIVADVASPAGRDALVAAVREQFGDRLDLLVHNAALQCDWKPDAPAADHAAQSEAELAVNLSAPLLLSLALTPALGARPGARIVFLTSVLALAPKASAPVYCATKAALRSLAASLRVTLASQGIGVSDAMPPLVDTDMTAGRGARKMAPETVAAAIVRGVETDRDEIPIGAARALRVLHRWWPGLVARMMIRQ